MNLSLLFARRYLFAKKSHNAINIITAISMLVLAVVTAAMVVVLSATNGISSLVDTIYSPFDQDITITPARGKTFSRDSIDRAALETLPDIEATSWTIEENVLLRCGDRQAVATLKGVEPQYLAMSNMAEYVYAGDTALRGPDGDYALLGIGLRTDLDVPLKDGVFQPLEISAPVRGRKLSKHKQGAFESRAVAMGGTFSMNLTFDSKYSVVPIDLANELLHYEGEVSALEMKVKPGADADAAAQLVRDRVGNGFTVKTRYQKNELMYRTNETEKWVTFTVLCFIALIGAFNLIASITMLMIEKQKDMRTLTSMGAEQATIRGVFFAEGMLITVVGTLSGIALGLLLCWLQQRFGLLAMQDSVVEFYPVKVLPLDLVLITGTMLLIGFIASRVPLRGLSRRFLVSGQS
ncbi:MAG: ABC transporter permease [Flavobacteriales bacterium]|nr:ABC transporter permease [Flavobacteriales bacterium]MBK9194799.1 ABC transporter permease [Flavobacteriales bacterium]